LLPAAINSIYLLGLWIWFCSENTCRLPAEHV